MRQGSSRTATPDDRLIGRLRPFLKDAGALLAAAPPRAYPPDTSETKLRPLTKVCHVRIAALGCPHCIEAQARASLRYILIRKDNEYAAFAEVSTSYERSRDNFSGPGPACPLPSGGTPRRAPGFQSLILARHPVENPAGEPYPGRDVRFPTFLASRPPASSRARARVSSRSKESRRRSWTTTRPFTRTVWTSAPVAAYTRWE